MNEDKRAEMAERSRVVADAHVWQDAFCATISSGRRGVGDALLVADIGDAMVAADKALSVYRSMTRRDD